MVSRVIRVLDDAGLIRRKPDPADLRAARVEITPDGVQVHEHVREVRTRVLTDCLEHLPPRRRTRCSRPSPPWRTSPKPSADKLPVS
jgi:DNA-binding MarR family transcriptional regulator